MKNLCAQCNVCEFVPEYVNRPVMYVQKDDDNPPPILVLDDMLHSMGYGEALLYAHDLFGPRIADFTYSTTMRCVYNAEDEDRDIATARCAVWTHSLLENRLVTLATLRGLQQMGIKDRKEGDAFRSSKYGLVLCIPPLWKMTTSYDFALIKTKTQRLLKEANLL